MQKNNIMKSSLFCRKTLKSFCVLIFVSLILEVIFIMPVNAIDVKAKFITMDDGLVNNTVRYIYQDSKGFIWFATINGLSRYDGYNFKTLMPRNDGKPSLADRRVFSMKEDKHGLLWIKMSPNLMSCYELRTERFIDFSGCGEQMTHYRDVTFIGNNTWLWGEDGCRRVEYKDGQITSECFTKENKRIATSQVRRVCASKAGTWIVAQKGLYLWNNGKLLTVNNSVSFMWVADICGRTYIVATDGTLYTYKGKLLRLGGISDIKDGYDIPGQFVIGGKWYLFTSRGGYVFDANTNRLEPAVGDLDIKNAEVNIDNKGNYLLQNKTGLLRRVDRRTGKVKTFKLMPESKAASLDKERYHIVETRGGIAWITTNGCGLYAYDIKKDKLYHYTADNSDSSIIPTNSQLCITEDRSGNIWLGTWQYGAVKLTVTSSDAYEKILRTDDNAITGHVRMVAAGHDGVWIANTAGMMYHADVALHNVLAKVNTGINIYAFCRDAKGKTWLGSRTEGLFVDGRQYKQDKNNKTSLSNNAVFAIQRDSNGRMWIGTFGGGLNLAVPDGHGGYLFKSFFNSSYGLRRIRCMSQDKNGWMWVGTSEGLIVFNPNRLIKNSKDYYLYDCKKHVMCSDEIRSLLCDRYGNMWVAETSCGFAVCRPEKDYSKLRFKHYDTGNGLANGMVQAFVEDRLGHIWITTDYGISCFNPKNGTLRNYLFASDMAGNIYSENCAAALPDGRLLFGTCEGVVVLNPERMAGNERNVSITFTDLSVNGIRMTDDDADYPLEEAMPYAKNISLKHNQNSFTVSFSALEFLPGTETFYSYWLEGYDKGWSEASRLNFASYKNVFPGTYRLHVRATNHNGTWSKGESVITITIAPPIWATPWAYILYSLLIIFIVYITLRTLRKMDALRTQMKVEEQMADYKLVFFTNISHEFRTPLTLMQAALERIERSRYNTNEHNSAVSLMKKSIDRLLRLINELIEFRKAEKGKLTLQLERIDAIPLLQGYYDMFKDTAASKNITYKFKPSTSSLFMPVDCGKLDKIMYNLLSNAFKYTPMGGSISLEVKVDDGQLIIKVVDTGIGIPVEKRERMFTRYASGNVSRNSIGIGLHLVHELVIVHKGTVGYDENVGGGSVFTVKLPVDDSVYASNDWLSSESGLLDTEDTKKAIKEKPARQDRDIDISIDNPMNDRVILVIEDDDDVRSFLVSELSKYATVVARPDGTSGYEYAQDNDVDLILCDVMMPGIDGFEVTKRIKGDFATSHIPVILLTALSAEDSKLKGAQCGADSYITKPFSTQLLLTCVFKLIEQREKLKEKFSSDITVTRTFVSVTDSDKVFSDRLTKVVEMNLSNPYFTVDDFADALSLGHTIMYRKIKGVTGYAPKTYLRIVRMKKAAEMLQKSDMNVSEVAYAVGMNDPLYFSKCFKQQFGVSPSIYKKNMESATDI